MKKLVRTKAGVFLFVGAILATWMLLAAQHVQAHTQPLPSCSGLPADDFFVADPAAAANDETAAITAVEDGQSPGLATKAGTDQSGEGNDRYRYAKITVPQLAAGELRVFSTEGAPADAILCYGSSRRAYYKTTYDSDHNREERAARIARTAAATARTAATNAEALRDRDPNPNPSGAEDNARSALRIAASALDTVSRALETAGQGARATDPNDRSGNAGTAQTNAETVRTQGTTHTTDNPKDNSPDGEIGELGTAAGHLETAAGQLESAVEADHADFMLRAKVNPGEGEYILVTVQSDPTMVELNVVPTTGPTLAVQFHGALSAGSRKGDIPKGGDVDIRTIRVTAPGLLTLGTTGSTDTKGNLSTVHAADVYVNGGGSGGNFSMAVPVLSGDTPHTLTVAGQGSKTEGTFTLTMDFAVAMRTAAVSFDANNNPPTTATLTAVPTWTTDTGLPKDDATGNEPIQIARRSEDGNQADQDLFVITPASSGLLTVTGNDGTGKKNANTNGAFLGPLGQIATDTNSGPGGTHFGFVVPVTATTDYLVRVTGTDGMYTLDFDLDIVVHGETDTTVQPTSIFSGPDGNGETIALTDAAQQKKNRNRYLFNITDSGTLYLQTTGDDDVRGTLYGPDGKVVASNDNGGKDRNFRIVTPVEPGLYLLEVEGATRSAVTYNLTANFAIGVTVDDPDPDPDPAPDPDPDPGTGTPGTDLNPTGFLDEPPNNGFRSGIGTIRGWVCQDDGDGVEIRIMNAAGTRRVATFTAPYGSDRSDVPVRDRCDRRGTDVGFAVQYNYNLLPEGEYTAEAWIGSGRSAEQVGPTDAGQTNRFTVVRISDDAFLEDVESGEVEVPDFPVDGVTTILEWDQQSQNFQIVDIVDIE